MPPTALRWRHVYEHARASERRVGKSSYLPRRRSDDDVGRRSRTSTDGGATSTAAAEQSADVASPTSDSVNKDAAAAAEVDLRRDRATPPPVVDSAASPPSMGSTPDVVDVVVCRTSRRVAVASRALSPCSCRHHPSKFSPTLCMTLRITPLKSELTISSFITPLRQPTYTVTRTRTQ